MWVTAALGASTLKRLFWQHKAKQPSSSHLNHPFFFFFYLTLTFNESLFLTFVQLRKCQDAITSLIVPLGVLLRPSHPRCLLSWSSLKAVSCLQPWANWHAKWRTSWLTSPLRPRDGLIFAAKYSTRSQHGLCFCAAKYLFQDNCSGHMFKCHLIYINTVQLPAESMKTRGCKRRVAHTHTRSHLHSLWHRAE